MTAKHDHYPPEFLSIPAKVCPDPLTVAVGVKWCPTQELLWISTEEDAANGIDAQSICLDRRQLTRMVAYLASRGV